MDYSKIIFSKPVVQGDRYFVGTTYGDDRIIKQFNKWMKCNTTVVGENGRSNHIDVTINGSDTDVSPFIEYASDFEDAMLKMAKEKKAEWFPDKDISDGWLEQAFHSGFKQIKKTNDAVMRFKLAKDMDVYTSNKKKVEIDDIKENVSIALIVLMDGLWFTKSRFGLTWKVIQAKVKKENEPNRTYMFDDDANPEPQLDNVFPDEV